jgi:F420-non-reducing hydrogenase large subunit
MYMGHILHSHALSTFVLTGPDILAGLSASPEERNVFNLLKLQPEVVKKVLRLRSIGQRIVETVGGRGVHPVTSVPGGITSAPSDEEMASMASWGKEALGILDEMKPVVDAKLEAMSEIRAAVELPYSSAALSDDGTVCFFEAPCVVMEDDGSVSGTFRAGEYADHLVEHAMEGSYMKSVRLRGDAESNFFVGPLARLNVNERFSTPRATEMLGAYREKGHPRKSALDFIEARLVEMVHCAERVGELASKGTGGELMVDAKPSGGRYVGMVEAPRGILIHEYEADDEGRLTGANLIVATQNNYDAIDHSISALASLFADAGDDNLLMNGVEFALRCYDPCLACATHAAGRMPMIVEVRRDGRTVRTVRRGGRG